jgi:ubiquinone/menaquinone biosynthesis C-methylase UbiE
MNPTPPAIDVKDLIRDYSVEELNEAAEEYFARLDNWDRLLAKPFSSSNDAIHLLVQTSYLLQGLDLYPGMKILDFGCGPGWASRMLNQMGFEVISLDVSQTALLIGAELARRQPVFGDQPPHHFMQFDGRHMALPDACVDRIFCLDALHHVPNQQRALSEMSRVLRTGGIAGFAEPGPAHSKDPSSQLEMRSFKVIENDIVLEDILATAKRVGFTDMKVAIGSTYPLRVSLDRFVRFPDDADLATEFLQSTAHRVTNFPVFFLHKGTMPVDDSRNMEGLVAEIVAATTIAARAGSPFSIDVAVNNVSTKRWLKSGTAPGSVNVGGFIHPLGSAGKAEKGIEFRFHLSDDGVRPGCRVGITIQLGPLTRGQYRVDIDLVSEHVRWFQANGSRIASVDVTVS